MDRKRVGMLAVITASLMWAFESILGKLSYGAGSDFFQTSAVRAFVIVAAAAAYIVFVKRKDLRVKRVHAPKLVYVGIVGMAADLLYFYSLSRISVINVVMIAHMQPIFIILMGFFILSEDRITKFDYAGISILTAAALFVTTKTMENIFMLRFGTVEDALVLIATICWATVAIVARKYLKSLDAGILTFYRYLTASVVFAACLVAMSSAFMPSAYQIMLGLVVCTGIILYYEGLKRLKAAQVSALELSTPFFAALLGFFIIGEAVTSMQILGIVMLFIGVYFLAKREQLA